MQNLMEIMMVVLPEPEMYRHKVKDFKKPKKKNPTYNVKAFI